MEISNCFLLYRSVIPQAPAPKTHFSRTSRSECLENFFRNIQKKYSRKANIVAPNLSNISGRKCL